MTGSRRHRLPHLSLRVSSPKTTPLLRRLARLAAPLTVLAVLAAPGANAETLRHDDALRDVRVGDYPGEEGTRVDPRETSGDLSRITIDATSERVQVALSSRDGGAYDTTFKILTSKGDTFRVLFSPYGPAGGTQYIKRNGYNFTCAGVTTKTTQAGVLLRFSQSCLGSAYRVRVGANIEGLKFDGEDHVERGFVDDVFRVGKSTSQRPALGPWVIASRAP